MYARTFSATFQPPKLDEVVRAVQALIVPVAKVQGFVDLVLLLDPATGNGMSVSMWAGAADRAASETNDFLRSQLAVRSQTVFVATDHLLYVHW